MIFNETGIPGVFIIEPELLEDERGFFARTWDQLEAEKIGLNPHVAQCNISFNKKRGTLRGMHFQEAPHAESKLVRCTMGAIYDVVIDLRPEAKTFMNWLAVELTAENRRILYIPEGLAHGFQALTSNSEVFYQMSEFYDASSASGVRWNDPSFNIQWPITPPILSERDRSFPDFKIGAR